MKTRLYKSPPPYLIVLASSVKTKEVEVIEFYRIVLLSGNVGHLTEDFGQVRGDHSFIRDKSELRNRVRTYYLKFEDSFNWHNVCTSIRGCQACE